MKLNLTDNQIAVLTKNLLVDKQMCKQIEVFSYTDLLVKLQSMIKLCRVVALSAGDGNTDPKDVIWEMTNLLEIAEQFAELFEEMELLDNLRKELV